MSKETIKSRKRAKKLSLENDILIQTEKMTNTVESLAPTRSTHYEVHTENDGKCVDLANLTGYLYTTLESSLASGHLAHQVKSLHFLAKSDVVDMEQVKRVVAQVASLCPEKSSNLLTALRNAQIRIQGAERHEVFLLQVLDYLWKGDLEEAHKRVNPDLKGLGAKSYTKEGTDRGSQACSGLLKFYGILLEHEARIRDEGGTEDPLHVALGNLVKRHRPYLHLFAEPYIFFLVKDAKHAQAEHFIKKCVKEEMEDRCASSGISPLLAYELVHHYLPKASQELKLYILESIGQLDPTNPLVIELCRIYWETPASKKFSLEPSTRRCRLLELLMNFLEQQAPFPLPPVCIEAWKMLSEVLSAICKKGSDEEVKKIIEIWQLNRKWYWPRRHFRIHQVQEDASLQDKALVCFLLSDTDDNEEFASFPENVILIMKNKHLDTMIKELNSSQTILRGRFHKLLPEVRLAKYPYRLPESDEKTTSSVPSKLSTLSRVEEEEDLPLDVNVDCYGPDREFNKRKLDETNRERTKERRTRKHKGDEDLLGAAKGGALESAPCDVFSLIGNGKGRKKRSAQTEMPPNKAPRPTSASRSDEDTSAETDRKRQRRAASGATDPNGMDCFGVRALPRKNKK